MTNQNKKTSYIVIGFFWICLFIYIRFLVTRPTYNFSAIKETLPLSTFILFVIFIFVHIIIISFIIYRLIFPQIKKDAQIILGLKMILNKLYTEPLNSIHDLFAPHLPYSGILFCKLSEYLDKHSLRLTQYIVIFFFALPKIIVAFIFFIEVIFYAQLHYFIYSIIFLMIPLLWNLFVKFFISFSVRNMQEIKTWLDIIPKGNKLFNGLYDEYDFYMKPHYDSQNLKEYVYLWKQLIKIYAYGNTYFLGFSQKITPYVTLFCSTLYIIAGIFRVSYFL